MPGPQGSWRELRVSDSGAHAPANALALVGDSHPQPPGGPQWENLLPDPLQRTHLQASSTRTGSRLAVQSAEGVWKLGSYAEFQLFILAPFPPFISKDN